MSWFFFALISLCFFVSYDLLSRSLAINSKSPRAFALLYNTIAGLISLVFLFFEPFRFSAITPMILALTALMIILYGLFNRYEYYAHKYIEASMLTLIIKIASITTFLLSIIVLRESLTILKLFAAGLIFSGIVLVTYKKGVFRVQEGIGYGFFIAIILGFAWTVDKVASSHFSLPLWCFMSYIIPNIFVIPFPMLHLKDVAFEWRRLKWRVVILSMVGSCGYFFFMKALSLGEASKIILITSCSTILTVLLAIIILKERTNLQRKILAAMLAVLGQLILYFG